MHRALLAGRSVFDTVHKTAHEMHTEAAVAVVREVFLHVGRFDLVGVERLSVVADNDFKYSVFHLDSDLDGPVIVKFV